MDKRKERAHRLISLGALFEIADLMDVEEAELLGYLLKYKDLSENEKKMCHSIGSHEMKKRAEKKKK